MTLGVVIHVPLPIQAYDALHGEVLRTSDPSFEGLLLHVARPTDEGFDVVEVWRSREDFDRYNAEVVAPAMARLAPAGAQPAAAEPVVEEFEVRGLVIPRGGVVR